MGVRKNNAGKVVKKLVNGTIFDVRLLYKITTDAKTNKSAVAGSSYSLFVGKHNVKSGFKNVESAAAFALENEKKYNRKDHKFENV